MTEPWEAAPTSPRARRATPGPAGRRTRAGLIVGVIAPGLRARPPEAARRRGAGRRPGPGASAQGGDRRPGPGASAQGGEHHRYRLVTKREHFSGFVTT